MRVGIISALFALVLVPVVARAELDANGNLAGGEPTHGTPLDPTPISELVQVFDNQADFLAAAGVVTTEDFEDEATTAGCSGGAVAFMSFADFDVASEPAALKVIDVPCFGNHNTTPGGIKYLSADTDVGFTSADVTFTFNESLLKFGLYLIDLEEPLQIVINGAVYDIPAGGDGSERYFGIIETTPFTVVEVVSQNQDSHNSFDDIAYGAEAPTPTEERTWGSLKVVYR